MARIFLSYAREDLDRIETIVSALSDEKHDVWWDRRIVAGSSFDRTIEKQIEECDFVVVAWSNNSVDSDWVRAEASAALQLDKIVPVLLEECLVPLQFRMIQAADLRNIDDAKDVGSFAKAFSVQLRNSASEDEPMPLDTTYDEPRVEQTPITSQFGGPILVILASAVIALGVFAVLRLVYIAR